MYEQLTNEDLVALFQKEGENSEKQNEILQVMYDRMKGMIVELVKKYKNIPNTTEEDRISTIYYQIYRAMKEFDSGANNKFYTVCYSYSKRGLNSLYKNNTRLKRRGQELLGLMDDVDIPTNTKEFDNIMFFEQLKNCGLTKKQYDVCVAFSEGKNGVEVSEELGISPQNLNWYKKSIKQKLVQCGF